MHRTMIVVAVLVTASVGAAEAACPIGSYEWVDNWGNQICKSFGSGQTTTIEGGLDNCPVGTFPWVDSWGNRTCKSFGSRNQYYDTSGGCPIGTFPWVDNWGNNVCRRF